MTEISKEYGTALFMLAAENGKQREYDEALSLISTVFAENPEYSDFLASPGVSLEERLSAIDAAFASLPEDVMSYLKLLCERGRIGGLNESIKEYKQLLAASEHVSTAFVTSAVELTEEEISALKKKLEAYCHSTVSMEFSIDPSLLGGLIVEIDGRVFDGSVRHHLNEVKDVISQ